MAEKLTWGQLADQKIKDFDEDKAEKKEARQEQLAIAKTERYGKKPLTVPHKRQKAIRLIATGEKTTSEIAQEFGITGNAVTDFRKRNIEKINAERERLLEKVPDIINTVLVLLKDYADPERRGSMEKTLLQHAHDHTIRILEASKVYPAKGKGGESILDLSGADKVQVNLNGISKEELRSIVMDLIRDNAKH